MVLFFTIPDLLMTKHEDLEVGREFPFVSYELTPSVIDKYKEAVDDCSQVSTFVPPLAIAAYTIRAMSASLSLPPGSVHALQELEFFKPVTIGSCVDCHARVI